MDCITSHKKKQYADIKFLGFTKITGE